MKNIYINAALLALFTTNTLAIENGTPLPLDSYPSLVEMDCTGTIIAAKWVLTAAHCFKSELTDISLSDGQRVEIISTHAHPNYENGDYVFVDMALWELAEQPAFDKILLLDSTIIESNAEPELTILGFGGTDKRLHSTVYKPHPDGTYPNMGTISLYRPMDISAPDGKVTNGDSGGPNLLNGKISALTTSGGWFDWEGQTMHSIASSRISHAKDFILDTVNAWHFPTEIEIQSGETMAIQMQSLHNDTVIDNATTDGNLVINVDASSCITKQIQPFETCTYSMTSIDGYEARIDLGNQQFITVNKDKTAPTTPESTSGGSMGWFGLLCLSALIFRNKTKGFS